MPAAIQPSDLLQSVPPSAAPLRLKRRADFLRAAKGKRFHAKGFTLQAGVRADAGETLAAPRFGFTVTKKIGGAVVRNRIRRRLKEAARTAGALPARAGHDYVLIARIEALHMAFPAIKAELVRALGRIDAAKSKPATARSQAPRQDAALESGRLKDGGEA
jgi:ribonuclease P protein component